MKRKITKEFNNHHGTYHYSLWEYKKYWFFDAWICVAKGFGIKASDWARHYGIDKP